MFVLKQVADVKDDIEVTIPGEKDAAVITPTWRLHTVTETRDLLHQNSEGELNDDDLIKGDLLALDGVHDENGEPMKMTKALIEQLLDMPYVRPKLVQSWLKSQNGRAEYAAKN